MKNYHMNLEPDPDHEGLFREVGKGSDGILYKPLEEGMRASVDARLGERVEYISKAIDENRELFIRTVAMTLVTNDILSLFPPGTSSFIPSLQEIEFLGAMSMLALPLLGAEEAYFDEARNSPDIPDDVDYEYFSKRHDAIVNQFMLPVGGEDDGPLAEGSTAADGGGFEEGTGGEGSSTSQ